jgi:hypothetical protein
MKLLNANITNPIEAQKQQPLCMKGPTSIITGILGGLQSRMFNQQIANQTNSQCAEVCGG